MLLTQLLEKTREMASFKSFWGFDHRLPTRTRLATIRSDYFDGRTQVLSSKTRRQRFSFGSPPSKPIQPDPPEERMTCCEFQAFQQVFQHNLADFGDQTTRSSDSRHDLGEKASNLTKSLPNPARSHWILDGSGEILLIFSFFSMVFGGFQLHPKSMLTRRETDT